MSTAAILKDGSRTTGLAPNFTDCHLEFVRCWPVGVSRVGCNGLAWAACLFKTLRTSFCLPSAPDKPHGVAQLLLRTKRRKLSTKSMSVNAEQRKLAAIM